MNSAWSYAVITFLVISVNMVYVTCSLVRSLELFDFVLSPAYWHIYGFALAYVGSLTFTSRDVQLWMKGNLYLV